MNTVRRPASSARQTGRWRARPRPAPRDTSEEIASIVLHPSQWRRWRGTTIPGFAEVPGIRRAVMDPPPSCRRCAGNAPPAFGIERVIDHEFTLQDLMIREAERTEAMGDPAQA